MGLTDMKFDVIIGNPPYNRGIDIDFINISMKLGGYLALIVPAKWQTAEDNQRSIAGTGYGEMREKLYKRVTKVIFYPYARDIFDILQSDGISIIVAAKEKMIKETIVENRSKHIKIINSKSNRRIDNRETLWNCGDQIISLIGNVEKYSIQINTLGRYEVWTNNKLSGGGLATIESNRKVYIIGESNIIDTYKEESDYTGAYTLMFKSDSLGECKSYISWLNTKLTRALFMFGISKLSNTLTDYGFRFVPMPVEGFNHIYSDEELFNKYRLSEKQIKFIESIIKDR